MNQHKKPLPSWKIIAGHGSHIKATRDLLIIQEKGKTTELPLKNLDHLMIIGGHNIQTSAITMMVNNQIFISFLESDGEPAGYVRPYGYQMQDAVRELKENISPFSYALVFAKGAIREQMLAIERWNEEFPGGLLFTGELEILNQAAHELDNFIKIEEIHRIYRLIGDMYYEIMSRMIHSSLHFKRRTTRPYKDPVNAILSFGNAMLTSSCTKTLISVHMDPDDGILNRGRWSLSLDFANCFKTRMVDRVALDLIRSGDISQDSYDCGGKRCILAEPLVKRMVPLFKEHISQDIITTQVQTFVRALNGEEEFEIHRF